MLDSPSAVATLQSSSKLPTLQYYLCSLCGMLLRCADRNNYVNVKCYKHAEFKNKGLYYL